MKLTYDQRCAITAINYAKLACDDLKRAIRRNDLSATTGAVFFEQSVLTSLSVMRDCLFGDDIL